MATNRSSALFTARETTKLMEPAHQNAGREVRIYFEATIVSTSAAADTYDLFTIPANWTVVDLVCAGNAMGASAGSSVDAIIGDSGDDDRYMTTLDMDAASAIGRLAATGVGYRTTTDTVVEIKFDAAPVVGKVVKGYVWLAPPE